MSTRVHHSPGLSIAENTETNNVYIKLKHEVNCRVPWVINSDLEICDASLAKMAADVYFEAQKNPPCLQPCCTAEIDINNKFTTRTEDGSTEMVLNFPPSIKFYVEIEVYGLVSMLAGEAEFEKNFTDRLMLSFSRVEWIYWDVPWHLIL